VKLNQEKILVSNSGY